MNSLVLEINMFLNSGFIPEYIICDPDHYQYFRDEVHHFTEKLKNKAVFLGSIPAPVIDKVVLVGYVLKIITRVEKGDDAHKGIYILAKCKSK